MDDFSFDFAVLYGLRCDCKDDPIDVEVLALSKGELQTTTTRVDNAVEVTGMLVTPPMWFAQSGTPAEDACAVIAASKALDKWPARRCNDCSVEGKPLTVTVVNVKTDTVVVHVNARQARDLCDSVLKVAFASFLRNIQLS